MRYLESLTVRLRLIVLASLGAVLSLAIGAEGLMTLSQVNDRLSDMYENNLVPVGDLGNSNMQAIYHNRALLTYVIESKQTEMDKISLKLATYESRMAALLDKYRKTELTPQERELLAKFDKSWPPYMASAKKVMAFSYADKNTEAMQEFNATTVPLFQVADDLLSEIYDFNIALGKKNDDEGQLATNSARNLAIGLTVVGVLCLVAMSNAISTSITSVLGGEPKNLSDHVDAIAQGDLSREIRVQGSNTNSLQARMAYM
jgi:methyl-accepting chemotaxis protein